VKIHIRVGIDVDEGDDGDDEDRCQSLQDPNNGGSGLPSVSSPFKSLRDVRF
jgi:hypothetical protein